MAQPGGFDAVFQFRPTVIGDILKQQLNDPLTTTPQSHTFVRRFAKTEVIPQEVAAAISFATPEVDEWDEDRLVAKIAISGGVRLAHSGQNLGMKMTAALAVTPEVNRAGDGVPYVAALPERAEAMILSDPHLRFYDSTLPVSVPALEATRALGPLRPLIADAFLQPISRLAHSYALASVPARFGTGTTPVGVIPLWGVAARVLGGPGTSALALGLSFSAAPADIQHVSSAFDTQTLTNAALMLSEAGLNRLVELAIAQGRLAGSATNPQGYQLNWRWERLQVALRAGNVVEVAGDLEMDGLRRAARVDFVVMLDAQQRLRLAPRGEMDGAMVTAAWSALHLVLGSGADPHDEQLIQGFHIPGTRIALLAPATEIGIAPGALTLRYQVPLSREPFSFSFPDLLPTIAIEQRPAVAVQGARGQAIAAHLNASVTADSFPPYDWRWEVENGALGHGETFTVIKTPTGKVKDGVLTKVGLVATDLLGHSTRTTALIRYRLARRQHGPGRWLGVAAALLVGLLLLAGLDAANPDWPFNDQFSQVINDFFHHATITPTAAPGSN